jgi:hypothetical protein
VTTPSPAERDGAGGRRQQAGDGAQQRRLARAVGAEECDDFGTADTEIDAVHHADLAVAGMQASDFEQGISRRGRH